MPTENEFQWGHPNGMDVLKRLGIVDRSTASVSEGDDELDQAIRMKRQEMLAASNGSMGNGIGNGGDGEFMNDDSDDNEFIFDRASLLRGGGRHPSSDDDQRGTSWFNNRRTQNMSESRRVFCCRGFLAALAFFIVGLCISLIGPTVGNLPALTSQTDETGPAWIISTNAFGAVLGIVLCAGCNTILNTFCIMMLALSLCSITTLVVPWCTTLTGATMVFMLQGVAYGFVERGCYSIFQTYWRRRHSILILFYIAFALGAAMSPLIASSYFVLKPTTTNTSVHVTNDLPNDTSSPTSPALLRAERAAAIAAVDPNLTSAIVACNETIGENCTNIAENGTISVATSTPHPVKPKLNEASGLDHHPTHTEQKVEALAKADADKSKAINETAANPGSTTAASSTVSSTTAASTTSASTTPSTTTSSSTTTTTASTTTTSTPSSTAASSSTSTTTAAATVSSSTGSTTPAPTMVQTSWEDAKKQLAQMNSFQLAYVTVASISIFLTVLYALICCFTPCRTPGPATGSSSIGGVGDYRLHLNGLFKSRTNIYAVVTSLGLGFMLVSLESVLTSLLTVYVMAVDAPRLHSGIIATSVFWMCVSVARTIAACFHGRLAQPVPMASCLGLALFSTSILVVFNYWPIVWITSSIVGLCYGGLYPLTYCWLEQQLAPAPWFATVWCLCGQLARMTAPLCASTVMFRHSTKDFLFALLVIALFACCAFALARSSVREAAALLNADQKQQQQRAATCKVKFGGSDTLFEYQNFNNLDGGGADDEVTYFDRSRDAVHMNGVGGAAPLFELNPKRFDRH